MSNLNFKKIAFIALLISGIPIVFALNETAIKTEWGYSGYRGPNHWSQLNTDFALCETGKHQSPINIKNKIKLSTHSLTINYKAAPMVIMDNGTTDLIIGEEQTIINDGHGLQLNFSQKDNEIVNFNQHAFRLVQFHIHTPAENKLGGKLYPLEIHFVHQGEKGNVLVIGVLAQLGEENPVLEKIIANLPKQEGEKQAIIGERINPLDLIPSNHNYYYFMGSLTTPPCSEGVKWIVMQQPISATQKQISAIKAAADGSNARPVQPLNKREVFLQKE